MSKGSASLDTAMEAYYEDIRAAMRMRGATPNQATEIVHDLYIRLSANPGSLDRARSLKAFLIRSAVNLGIDRARRWAFEQRVFAALDAQTLSVARDDDEIENRLDLPRRIAFLRATILELPPQCRRVFIAYRVAGLSKQEIAEALGMKRRMVDRHLRNAMLHCLEKMDDFGRQ